MTAKFLTFRCRRALTALPVVLAVLAGCATFGARSISDQDFGLAKGSVFDDPASTPFSFEDETKLPAPAPGTGVPPMISHAVDEFLPLTIAKNECLDCHDKPANIGKPVAKNKASPASASHYVASAGGALRLAGTSFNCMACHAPQANATPLVVNTSR